MGFAKAMRVQRHRVSKPEEVTDALTWLINFFLLFELVSPCTFFSFFSLQILMRDQGFSGGKPDSRR